MVTKHNRENMRPFKPTPEQCDQIMRDSMNAWPFEPQVMSDDEQENAYTRLLEQEDEPPVHGDGVIKFLTGLTVCVILLLGTLAGWHFIAWWLA